MNRQLVGIFATISVVAVAFSNKRYAKKFIWIYSINIYTLDGKLNMKHASLRFVNNNFNLVTLKNK